MVEWIKMDWYKYVCCKDLKKKKRSGDNFDENI